MIAGANLAGSVWGKQVMSRRAFALRISVVSLISAGSLFTRQNQMRRYTRAGAQVATAQPMQVSNRPVSPQRNSRYRIDRDDFLLLSFSLSPEFNRPRVMVQPGGTKASKTSSPSYHSAARIDHWRCLAQRSKSATSKKCDTCD